MHSRSLDYFSRGIARAIERRTKEQAERQSENSAVKSQTTVSGADVKLITPPITLFTKRFDEEGYRTSLITNMIKLIHSKRK
jgi:hypothetical protein